MARPVAADLTQEVDPFIGTVGGGNVFPGAAVPFGMVQWSPDTTAGGITMPGGYNHGDLIIRDFSLTHLSGAGCVALGNIGLMPVTRPVTAAPQPNGSPYSARFTRGSERASPGYYGVRLGSGIEVGITATTRTGFARIIFLRHGRPGLLIDAGTGAGPRTNTDGADSSSVRVDGPEEVSGEAGAGHFCGLANRYTVYFAARFDHAFSSYATWRDGAIHAEEPSAAGRRTGVYLRFATRSLQVQVALSYVSVAGARANLREETTGWNFRAACRRAAGTWAQLLNQVQVAGGSRASRRIFYTALYHSFLHPNVFSDVDGRYIGFDRRIHRARGYTHYANFSGWDIYRTQMPLVAWLRPQEASGMVTSLIADAQQGGRLPKWPVANDYTNEMNGDSADPIIAGAWAYGARHVDLAAALRMMVRGATQPGAVRNGYQERPGLSLYLSRGYLPPELGAWGSAATTLEYALDDYAIARVALVAGDRNTYRIYRRRAQNWRHIFNRRTGFIEPRTGKGTFPARFDPTSDSGFVEGNAWQYTWMVPQDLPGLFALMGKDRAIHRLDLLFRRLNAGQSAPYYWGGNEPGLEIPWEYDAAGTPWRTQQVLRRITSRLYTASPGGLPGNDDLGTLSAWYVWAALGLYPMVPGVAGFVISTPLFPRITVIAGDRQLAISAPGAESHPYIAQLRVNGTPYTRPWLPISRLARNASLQLSLSTKPNQQWGAGPNAWPRL